jgi:hypothetical protein
VDADEAVVGLASIELERDPLWLAGASRRGLGIEDDQLSGSELRVLLRRFLVVFAPTRVASVAGDHLDGEPRGECPSFHVCHDAGRGGSGGSSSR